VVPRIEALAAPQGAEWLTALQKRWEVAQCRPERAVAAIESPPIARAIAARVGMERTVDKRGHQVNA